MVSGIAAVGLALTFGIRMLALWIGVKADKFETERRLKIIDA